MAVSVRWPENVNWFLEFIGIFEVFRTFEEDGKTVGQGVSIVIPPNLPECGMGGSYQGCDLSRKVKSPIRCLLRNQMKNLHRH